MSRVLVLIGVVLVIVATAQSQKEVDWSILQWVNNAPKKIVVYDAKIDEAICRERCWR